MAENGSKPMDRLTAALYRHRASRTFGLANCAEGCKVGGSSEELAEHQAIEAWKAIAEMSDGENWEMETKVWPPVPPEEQG